MKDFEGGRRTPIQATLAAMQAALEREGIGFLFVNEDGQSCASGITYTRNEAKTLIEVRDSPVV